MVGECGTSKNGVVYNYYKCSNVKKRKGCHKSSIKKELAESVSSIIDEIPSAFHTSDACSHGAFRPERCVERAD